MILVALPFIGFAMWANAVVIHFVPPAPAAAWQTTVTVANGR